MIRWAFEKQGLFQAAGTPTPNNLEGAPPAVDVYIDDGRAGLYPYQPNWWSCQNIWNRLSPDGLTGHEDPAGGTNYAYVKIKNRGTTVANDVVVKAYHCKPSAGVLWPDDLQPMSTAQLSAGTLQPNNTEEKIIGPFEWTPTTNAFGLDTMMMIVSATGDPSNVDIFTPGRTVEDWRLVPNDNNIARRDVTLVRLATLIADSGSFGNVCVGSFKDEMLYLSNSGFNRVTVTAVTSSSAEFVVPSVLSYPLNIAPGSFLEVPIRFQPGSFGPKSATITVTSNDPERPEEGDGFGRCQGTASCRDHCGFRQLRQCVRGIVRGRIRHFEQQRPLHAFRAEPHFLIGRVPHSQCLVVPAEHCGRRVPGDSDSLPAHELRGQIGDTDCGK